MTFDTALQRISVAAVLTTDMGVYSLSVDASIPQPTVADPTAKLVVSAPLILTVGKDCFQTNFTFRLFKNMSVLLTQSTSQDITFTEAKEIEYNNPGYCGARTYTFAGGLPSYLQLDTVAKTLTLSSSNFADVGVHTVTFTVAL
jgi:hypothetical protein